MSLISIHCEYCGKEFRIPANKHIRFTCPNSNCNEHFEYKNGVRVRKNYWFLSVPILLLIIGFIKPSLYPIPLVLSISVFFWWLFKSSKSKIKRLLSNILAPTSIGLLVVFILQLAINFMSRPKDGSIPEWLLQLDNILLWVRQKLAYLSEISFGIYVLIILLLLFVAIKKPNWKPLTKFKALEGRVSKLAFIIIIITSFTFFAPSASETLADQSFYTYYKVNYREKLKQDRKKLIAEEFKKYIETHKEKEYEKSIPSLHKNILEIPDVEIHSSKEEADKDVKRVMSIERITKVKSLFAPDYKELVTYNTSYEELWKQEFKQWKEDRKTKSKSKKSPRRGFTEVQIAKTEKATVAANEAAEAFKSVLVKFIGSMTPSLDHLLQNYIDEVIAASAEYVYNSYNIDRIIAQFFSDSRRTGKIDLFSKIGRWRIQTDQRIAEDKKQKLKDDNRWLKSKIEQRINTIELGLSKQDKVTLKEELEREFLRPLAENEVNEIVNERFKKELVKHLATTPTNASSLEQNEILKTRLAFANGALNVMGLIASLPGSFSICQRCRLPIIPGTFCVIR